MKQGHHLGEKDFPSVMGENRNNVQPSDFAGNIERFSGFADWYDKYRPEPPAILGSLLTTVAGVCFRYTKEIGVHHTDRGNADRLVGLLLSQGGVRSLLKAGYREDQLGIDQRRKTARQILGDELQTWYWSAHIRLGIV